MGVGDFCNKEEKRNKKYNKHYYMEDGSDECCIQKGDNRMIKINENQLKRNYENYPCLDNFAGNCYLNSILQCFYYCNDLTEYFVTNNEEIKNKKGKLSNAYLNLIIALKKNERFNTAKNFFHDLQKVTSNFFKKGGNDPKAVLVTILQNLHDELKINANNEYDSYCEDFSLEKAFTFCKEIEQKNKSIISELFNWCLLSNINCNICSKNHYICEYRNYLLISLENYENFSLNLDNLIMNYFKDNTKKFICQNDEQKAINKVKYTKQIMKFPKIFIIILERKSNLKYKIEYNDNITFSGCLNRENNNDINYKLVGALLINEHATHAIAKCLVQDGIYCIFDDLNFIKNFLEPESFSPYILFYLKDPKVH